MPETLKRLPAEEFLKLASSIPVIDVRSPAEYGYGHIPGAFNIPLFDD
ncbi:MAG: tRNA 2-selenouridine(34) synthase MnmH, partial [Bacteroidales bacterium]|nr:tRNA 2-selenouridine(34) synthase MnmH [Bacteroidales bacterium]